MGRYLLNVPDSENTPARDEKKRVVDQVITVKFNGSGGK